MEKSESIFDHPIRRLLALDKDSVDGTNLKKIEINLGHLYAAPLKYRRSIHQSFVLHK